MNDTLIHNYLLSHIPERKPFFMELEAYAEQHEVPIMEVDSMHFMLQIMQIQQPKRILEIGTAIGYSALRMADALPDVHIVTMERDEVRYDRAWHNVHAFGAEDRIEVLLMDALEDSSIVLEKENFDAIFIDAAKAQYAKFFNVYIDKLAPGGVIYSDNVLFKGLALHDSPRAQQKQRVSRKMREFNDWLLQNPDFITTTVPLGDGLAISRRKEGAK
ncbi:class I SAM-dependent methyltransferase [Listeria rustica]|uniref:tRNA 5-hydroxyuridine methyltransferase n=1 Tax=Listeria rustica TaxID=2713503 RepID=A0A7W1YF42_9LIST|nr:O-methyltransferase [Listeria rustica]